MLGESGWGYWVRGVVTILFREDIKGPGGSQGSSPVATGRGR